MISVLCYSGGKDSTALWLWAQREKIEPRRVIFCDTGWEHPATLAYVNIMERRMGEPIVRLTGKETFEERVRRLRGFPSSGKRWCTDELKRQPTRRYLDQLREETGDEVQVLVGKRGGKQLQLVRSPGGCGRWGSCEAPPASVEEDDAA